MFVMIVIFIDTSVLNINSFTLVL